MARKTYIPDDPSTLFDFELGDEHRLRDPAGHRVRSRLSEEIATNRQGKAARNLNRSSAIQMDIFDFILLFPMAEASELFHEIDRSGPLQ